MNFKTLALATTLAITGWATGTSAQAWGTGYMTSGSGYSRSEAAQFCMMRGATPRVQTNMYSGQATGFWECITNGTGYNAGQIPMAR